MAKMIKNEDSKTHDAHGDREELRALLESFDTAMLVTKDSRGMPRARPMAMRQRPNDLALWFLTPEDAPKVAEIAHDPFVAAIFYRDGDRAWISVSGRAAIIKDRARIKELWTPAMSVWFTGPDDPQIALIRVEPHAAEYYEPKGTKVKRLFELVKGALTHVTPDLGAVKHVDRVDLTRLSEPKLTEPQGSGRR